MSERPLVLVDTAATLADLVADLERQSRVAADVEGDSFHAYHEKVCLVQLATLERDYVVDPLAVDLAPLGPLFADPRREVVFHAAEFDVMSLKRDYGFSFQSLFDTQAACMVLGESQVGLASLVERHFAVTLPKAHQRSDWARRPLTEAQLAYAAGDVRYLLDLREVLWEALVAADRADEAQALFERLAGSAPAAKTFDPEGFHRLKGYRELDAPGRAVARRLYLLREERARSIDRPPFKVLGNDAILRLSRERPRTAKDLAEVRGTPRNVRRWAEAILTAIAEGAADPEPPPVRRPRTKGRRDPEVEARYERLRLWRKEAAAERGVPPQVIARSQTLRAIAAADPRRAEDLAPLVDPYQLERYGAEILAALR